MKIRLEKYDPSWGNIYQEIAKELSEALHFLQPPIEHIGSTSVEGLAAKPVIDILVGLKDESFLDAVITPLTAKKYVFYEKYNAIMPYRRFFVKLHSQSTSFPIPFIIRDHNEIPQVLIGHESRQAHIHVLQYGSPHWTRHIAFRDYLGNYAEVRQEYQKLKAILSMQEWEDENAYNKAKDAFIKTEEQKAIAWYNKSR